MYQGLLRLLRILRSQSEGLNLSAWMLLLLKSLFKKENILVFGRELDWDVFTDDRNSLIFPKKGELQQLRNAREALNPPQWEFCLDIYDHVADFFVVENSDGIICHISWVYYKGDPNRNLSLDSDEAEIKYSFTVPEYRGKGLYPETLLEIQTYLNKNGCRKVFICVNEKNHASIKGVQKAGFGFIKKIRLMKFMGVQINRRFSEEN